MWSKTSVTSAPVTALWIPPATGVNHRQKAELEPVLSVPASPVPVGSVPPKAIAN